MGRKQNNGRLVTFGITPTRAETGYGYIPEPAKMILLMKKSIGQSLWCCGICKKPDLAKAQSYIASGDYYWNSGMFMFGAQSYLQN